MALCPSSETDEEIKEKYRRLQKIYHPDVWKGEDDAPSDAMSIRLNRAYSVLSDRKQREAYDKRLGAPSRSARAGAIRNVEVRPGEELRDGPSACPALGRGGPCHRGSARAQLRLSLQRPVAEPYP